MERANFIPNMNFKPQDCRSCKGINLSKNCKGCLGTGTVYVPDPPV